MRTVDGDNDNDGQGPIICIVSAYCMLRAFRVPVWLAGPSTQNCISFDPQNELQWGVVWAHITKEETGSRGKDYPNFPTGVATQGQACPRCLLS